MDGGEDHKLNVPAFLRYSELEKFYHVQCIYIPCGKTKGLYFDDIRHVCPDVLTIIHSKWLMYNLGGWRRCWREQRVINATESIDMTRNLPKVLMFG